MKIVPLLAGMSLLTMGMAAAEVQGKSSKAGGNAEAAQTAPRKSTQKAGKTQTRKPKAAAAQDSTAPEMRPMDPTNPDPMRPASPSTLPKTPQAPVKPPDPTSPTAVKSTTGRRLEGVKSKLPFGS